MTIIGSFLIACVVVGFILLHAEGSRGKPDDIIESTLPNRIRSALALYLAVSATLAYIVFLAVVCLKWIAGVIGGGM